MAESSPEIPASIVLERTSLCDSLNQHELDELASVTSRRWLEPGEVLCREGEHGASAYIVVSGSLEVYIGSGDDRQVLAVLTTNQLLGELALLEPEARTASVIAIEPTELVELSHAKLQELRDVMSSGAFKLIRAISQLICHRIRDINTLIEAELKTAAQAAGGATPPPPPPPGATKAAEQQVDAGKNKEVMSIFRRLFRGS